MVLSSTKNTLNNELKGVLRMGWSIWAGAILGVIFVLTSQSNEVNEQAYSKVGKKVFRSGIGYGMVIASIVIAILNHM